MSSLGQLNRIAAVIALATSALLVPVSALAETISIPLNKAIVLRISRPAATIMIGNPNIANIQLESDRMMFVLGLHAGETNILIMDQNNRMISNYDLVVVPDNDRAVTVHKSTDIVTTYSCDPRCTIILNPDEVENTFVASDLGGEATDEESSESDSNQ